MERLSLRQSIGRRWGRGGAAPAPDSPAPAPRARRPRSRGLLILSLILIGGLLLAGAVRLGTARPGGVLEIDPATSGSPPLAPDQPATAPNLGLSDATAKGTAGNLAAGSAGTASTASWDRMVIRTAKLGLVVKDVSAALEQVRALADAHNGYVTESDSHQDGDYTVASITLQVPTQEFDAVITRLHALGLKPAQETISSSDVTDEYTDLQSQLRNLQATEARLLALQAKADQLTDILTIDRELRQVQGDIEQAQGRINYLSQRSAMSTITVSLTPETLPVAVTPLAGWDAAAVVQRAWFASLDLLAGAATVVITAAVFLWWTVPLALLAAWVLRRPRRAAA